MGKITSHIKLSNPSLRKKPKYKSANPKINKIKQTAAIVSACFFDSDTGGLEVDSLGLFFITEEDAFATESSISINPSAAIIATTTKMIADISKLNPMLSVKTMGCSDTNFISWVPGRAATVLVQQKSPIYSG